MLDALQQHGVTGLSWRIVQHKEMLGAGTSTVCAQNTTGFVPQREAGESPASG